MFSAAATGRRPVVPAVAHRPADRCGRSASRTSKLHVCASRGARSDEGHQKREHRPRSTSPCASLDAHHHRSSVGPRHQPQPGGPDSSRNVKAKALRTNVTVASAAVLEARAPVTEEEVIGWASRAVPLHAPIKSTGKAAPRLQVVREQVPLQQRKAPSVPTSASSAAYLALGQAASPKKTKVSLVRRAGVDCVQAPSQASRAEPEPKDASAPPPPPAPITQSLRLDSSNVVSTVAESKNAERDVLERSWRISEEEREQRSVSSQGASTTTSAPPSPAQSNSRAWGGRKTPFVKPKRGGAVVSGRRVPASKAKSKRAFKAASQATPIIEEPEKDSKEALLHSGSESLIITQGRVDRLKRRAGNLRSKTVGRDGVEALGTKLLLSREEEGFLLRLVQRKLAVDNKAKEMKADNGGQDPTAKELAAEAGLKGGVSELQALGDIAADAREVMERCNIRLVVSIARKYHGQRDMDFRDLIQAGLTGLHKAFDRFDVEKGCKFSTYGHWWVRQGISRCLSKESRVVRLPGHVVDNLSRIYKTTARLAAASDNGAEPPVEEVAAALDMPVSKVAKLLQFGQEPTSMEGLAFANQSDKREEAMELMDTLTREDDENGLLSSSSWASGEEEQDRESMQEAVQETVDRMLMDLSPRERNIIKMHYGLSHSDGREQTFKDIGQAYGRTQERIRQVEDRAIRRLRRDHTKELGVLAGLNLLPL